MKVNELLLKKYGKKGGAVKSEGEALARKAGEGDCMGCD
jgi:hypothetical protein